MGDGSDDSRDPGPTPLIERVERSTRASLPVLRVVGGDRVRLAVLTLGSSIDIGRDEACALVVPDESVSRRHAVVNTDREGYVLEDLRSRNGTRVNGEPVTKALLTPGERLEVGNVLIRFEMLTPEELMHLQRLAERGAPDPR